MTKREKALMFIGVVFVVGLVFFLDDGSEAFNNVKSGKWELWCGIDSWQKSQYTDPALVTGYDIDSNSWNFINGYSSNCELKEVGI